MIALLHGRAPKPPLRELQALWFEALRRGLKSTNPQLLASYEAQPKTMIYYGDLSNDFLKEPGADIDSRRKLLDNIEQADFDEYRGELTYNIETPPPDILAYWDCKSGFGRSLRKRIQAGIAPLIESEEAVLLIAHSLGAVLIFDALCDLKAASSHLTLVTLGSPLTHPHFREKTTGQTPELQAWYNVSAKGDKICGPRIQEQVHHEHEILNPIVKDGEPDPHHALGYLRHPRVAKVLSDWLKLNKKATTQSKQTPKQ